MMISGKIFEVQEVGVFSPNEKPVEKLRAGEVGYILANIKNTADVKIGDTVTTVQNPAKDPSQDSKSSLLLFLQESIRLILQILKWYEMP